MADATVDIAVRSQLKEERRIASDFDKLFKSVERVTKETVKLNRNLVNVNKVLARQRTLVRHMTNEYRLLNIQLIKTNTHLATIGRRRQGLEANAKAMARLRNETTLAVNATNRLNRALARNRVIATAPVAASGAATATTAAVAGGDGVAAVSARSAALSRLDRVQRRVASSAFQLQGVYAALASVLVIRAITRASDEYISLQNRLRVITDTTEEFNAAQADVERIARVSQSAIRTTTSTYARFQLATERLGTSQRQIAAAVEATNLSFLVSGSTAREAEAATVQLAQGLSSGKFSGDELRSVLENNIILARFLAEALGTNVGFLRDLAAEGALNQSVVINTLIDKLPELRKRAEDIEFTFSRAFEQLNNSFVLFLGQTESANTATSFLIDTILGLANNIDIAIFSITALAGGLLAYKTAATVIVAVHKAVVITTASITAYTVAASYAATATRAFTLALVANPIGAVAVGLAVLTTGYFALSSEADNAAKSVEGLNNELSRGQFLRYQEQAQAGTLNAFNTRTVLNQIPEAERERQIKEEQDRIVGQAGNIGYSPQSEQIRANARRQAEQAVARRYLSNNNTPEDLQPLPDAARRINVPALVRRVRRNTDTELVSLGRERVELANALQRVEEQELPIVQAAIEARQAEGKAASRAQRDTLETQLGFVESLKARQAQVEAEFEIEQNVRRTELLSANRNAAERGRSPIQSLTGQIAEIDASAPGRTFSSNADAIEATRASLVLERDILRAQEESLGIQRESADVQSLIKSNLTDRQRIEQQIIQVQQTLNQASSPEAQQQLEDLLTVLEVRARRANDTLPELASVFQNLRSDAQQFGDASGRAFTRFALGAQNASKAAQALLQDIINIAAQRLITEPTANVVAIGVRAGFDALLTGGSQGRDVNAGGGSGFLPGAATGISGTFGGNSGTDNNVLSLNGNPFLRVSRQEDFEVIPQGKSGRGGGGGTTVIEVNAPISIGLGIQEGIAAEVQQIGEQLPGLIRGTITEAIAQRQIVI